MSQPFRSYCQKSSGWRQLVREASFCNHGLLLFRFVGCPPACASLWRCDHRQGWASYKPQGRKLRLLPILVHYSSGYGDLKNPVALVSEITPLDMLSVRPSDAPPCHLAACVGISQACECTRCRHWPRLSHPTSVKRLSDSGVCRVCSGIVSRVQTGIEHARNIFSAQQFGLFCGDFGEGGMKLIASMAQHGLEQEL